MASSFIAGKALWRPASPSADRLAFRPGDACGAAPARLDGPGLPDGLVPSGFGARRWIVLVLIGNRQTGGLIGLSVPWPAHHSPSTTAILIFTNPIWVALDRPPRPRRAADGAADRRSRLRRSRRAFALGFDHLADQPLGGKPLALAGARPLLRSPPSRPSAPRCPSRLGLHFWQMAAGTLVLLALAVVQGGARPQFDLGDGAVRLARDPRIDRRHRPLVRSSAPRARRAPAAICSSRRSSPC